MCCYLTVQIHVPESTFTSGHLPASHERRPKRQQVACSFFSFRTSSRPLYPPSSAVPPCPRRHQVDCPRLISGVLNDNRSPVLSSPQRHEGACPRPNSGVLNDNRSPVPRATTPGRRRDFPAHPKLAISQNIATHQMPFRCPSPARCHSEASGGIAVLNDNRSPVLSSPP